MMRPLLALAPRRVPAASPIHWIETFPAEGERRMRVALLAGCAQQVLAPQINLATIRLLTRQGCEVVLAPGSGCCGALTHHLGEEKPALAMARANIDAWEKAAGECGFDAVVANASGCGTMLKDYGFLLRTNPDYAGKAARIAGLARDVSEVVATLGLPAPTGAVPALRVAYHSACSLQHGQQIDREPKALLTAAGFTVLDVPEGHLCCGSAGTYNVLQPELAAALRERKLAQHSGDPAGCHRGRQYRLHHATRRRGCDGANRAHGRTARLGDRRPGAAGPCWSPRADPLHGRSKQAGIPAPSENAGPLRTTSMWRALQRVSPGGPPV